MCSRGTEEHSRKSSELGTTMGAISDGAIMAESGEMYLVQYIVLIGGENAEVESATRLERRMTQMDLRFRNTNLLRASTIREGMEFRDTTEKLWKTL